MSVIHVWLISQPLFDDPRGDGFRTVILKQNVLDVLLEQPGHTSKLLLANLDSLMNF